MEDSIRLFMWGYQKSFRIIAETDARQLFSMCDPRLMPQVFLIGVLEDPHPTRWPVCVEPEVNSLLGDRQLRPEDLETNTTTRADLENKLNALGEKSDAVHYCGEATFVEGYSVYPVLQMRRSAVNSHYSLKIAIRDLVRTSTSFLDALISHFLEYQSQQLERKNPGRRLGGYHRAPDDFLRTAGYYFTLTSGFNIGNLESAFGLFRSFNAIAELRYEGNECTGKMLLSGNDHPNVKMHTRFTPSIPLTETRTVRKLLETTDINRFLVCDGSTVLGLGSLKAGYDADDENMFEVHFIKEYCWDILHDNQHMMRVNAGRPELPKPNATEGQFVKSFVKAFSGLTQDDALHAWALVKIAIGLHRGCTLVMVQNAIEEAERLGKQSIRIAPRMADDSLVSVSTAIDGAILLDPTCICHAFGVILDGPASNQGDRARGSRYNSAVRYRQGLSGEGLVVVISEDGMIDIIGSPLGEADPSRAKL